MKKLFLCILLLAIQFTSVSGGITVTITSQPDDNLTMTKNQDKTISWRYESSGDPRTASTSYFQAFKIKISNACSTETDGYIAANIDLEWGHGVVNLKEVLGTSEFRFDVLSEFLFDIGEENPYYCFRLFFYISAFTNPLGTHDAKMTYHTLKVYNTDNPFGEEGDSAFAVLNNNIYGIICSMILISVTRRIKS